MSYFYTALNSRFSLPIQQMNMCNPSWKTVFYLAKEKFFLCKARIDSKALLKMYFFLKNKMLVLLQCYLVVDVNVLYKYHFNNCISNFRYLHQHVYNDQLPVAKDNIYLQCQHQLSLFILNCDIFHIQLSQKMYLLLVICLSLTIIQHGFVLHLANMIHLNYQLGGSRTNNYNPDLQ